MPLDLASFFAPLAVPSVLLPGEIVVDNFAGGGGASLGIEAAIGRPIDVAINHDPEAIAMHRANHPFTEHLCQSVWKARPEDVARGRAVGLAWFSPDCKHFSKAKGGAPKKRNIRDLAWVVVAWAKTVRPRVIMVENVEEFMTWGPLLADGTPCPDRKGHTFKAWVREMRRHGYKIEWKELRACDYGAPTIRKRLFVIARRDGLAITWPEPTHGPGRVPYRTAAECINWATPMPSVFHRERPLAEATLRRIARGIVRYVLQAQRPFVVRTGHWSHRTGLGFGFRGQSIDEPLATVCATNEKALVAPVVTKLRKGCTGHGVDEPLHTVCAGSDHHAVTTAELAGGIEAPMVMPLTHQGGDRARPITAPLATVTGANRGELAVASAALAAAAVTKFQQNSTGQHPAEPLHTVMAGAARFGAMAAMLATIDHQSNAHGVAQADAPVSTITAKNRHAVAAAFMAQHNTGVVGHSMEEPVSTIVQKGCTQGLVTAALATEAGSPPAHADGQSAAFLAHYYTSSSTGGDGNLDAPARTVTAGGQHHALVVADMSADDHRGAAHVVHFLRANYGPGLDAAIPDHARVPAPDGGFYVAVDGVPVVGIGMRMLSPRELFRAQGFPDEYQIEVPYDETLAETFREVNDISAEPKPVKSRRRSAVLTKTAQTRMCGNSVSPVMSMALVTANLNADPPEGRVRDASLDLAA